MAVTAMIVSTYAPGLQMLPEVSLPVSTCSKRGSTACFMHHIRSGLRTPAPEPPVGSEPSKKVEVTQPS